MPFGLPGDAQNLTYGDYLRVPELIALQQMRSEPAHHDEMLFVVIHQTYELWFKQILHELEAVRARMEADQVLGAHRLLTRCAEIARVLVQQVDILETMTPMDFLAFRDHLRPASGFQSAQFREIEFCCGLKDAAYLNSYHEGSAEHARLAERMAAPSLSEAFYELLSRRGFQPPVSFPDASPTDRARERERRVDELVRLYRDADQHYDLFLLAESLVELDEMFARWRLRHVKMVERMIGMQMGTGGSEGAGYLWKTVGRKFFPELWEVRSRLSADGGGYASPHSSS
jgi:tryptophan 2,3-dioxygenase